MVLKESLAYLSKPSISPPQGIFFKTEITQSESVQALVKRTVEVYGRVDNLIVTAGVGQALLPVQETTEDEFDSIMGRLINTLLIIFNLNPEYQPLTSKEPGYSINISSFRCSNRNRG